MTAKRGLVEVKIKVQKAFSGMFDKGIRGEWQEYALHSGRGAGKSYAAADYVIVKVLGGCSVLCGREVQNSIEESVFRLINARIDHYNLRDVFFSKNGKITCYNGATIIFKGLSRNIDTVKSMEGINLVWIEEAQTITSESMGILIPTILRNKGAQLLYTYNPRYADDAIWQRFHGEEPPPRSIVQETNYRENLYLTQAMLDERDFLFKHDEEVAQHVWEGALCPTSSAMSVIPLSWLRQCVDLHSKLEITIDKSSVYNHVGFDIADTGDDHCALAYRRGPLLVDVVEFDSKYIRNSVQKVNDYIVCKPAINRVFFDVVGVGAGASGDFNNIPNRKYWVKPYHGGSSPKGKDYQFVQGKTNGEFFYNLKAQSWYNIRLMAENSLRLIDGEDVDPGKCLFISKRINGLDQLLRELSQATWKHEDGKYKVNKAPNGEASPNMADAVIMSFTQDLSKGLRIY